MWQRCFRRLWTGFTWWRWYHRSALLALVRSLITSWKLFQVFNSDLGLSWSLDIHKRWKHLCSIGMTWMVFRRWGCQLPIQQQMRFNALEPLFGGEVLGQAARTEHLTLQTKHVPQKASKWAQQIWSNIIGVASRNISGTYIPGGSGKCFFSRKFPQPPQTRYISAQTPPFSATLFLLGLAGNDRFEQTWEVIHCTRACDLAAAFHQGCQISQITKLPNSSIQETWEGLFRTRTCGLA